MKSTTAACLLLACQISLSSASPLFGQQQLVLKKNDDGDRGYTAAGYSDTGDAHEWNVLHHLSGISPFFDSHGPRPDPPEQCVISSVSILARHSSITMNDDEFPETIEPFLNKLQKYKKEHSKSKKGKKENHSNKPYGNALAFLENWKTPVTEDNMEQLTGPGAEDAKKLGRRMGERYKHLISQENDPAIKIYTASSSRDVDSSTAFIRGMFPTKNLGRKKGEIDLIKVPNKNKDWAFSLTPHKICDRFDKKQGKNERNGFQKLVGLKTIERLKSLNELNGWNWNWTDIIAMQQMCGYETVIRGSSEFCNVFTEEEWLEFEYGQDLYYHHMLGRHRKWTAALGIPWIQVAAKNLKETRTKGIISPHVVPTPIAGRLGGASSDFMNIEKKKNRGDKKSSSTSSSSSFRLPQPTQGPNATLPQAFHIWFTHREEVPLVTHALDLFHGHDDATAAMPLDKINPTRVWKTSEIIPFLGHVSLERMECAIDGDDNDDEDGGNRETQSLVRIIVNGSPQEQPACHSGPGGSCPFEEFLELVDKLPEVYGKLKEVCQQEEDE